MKTNESHISTQKKGKTSAIDNYRPVAVLSEAAKLLETIAYSQIYNQTKHALTIGSAQISLHSVTINKPYEFHYLYS